MLALTGFLVIFERVKEMKTKKQWVVFCSIITIVVLLGIVAVVYNESAHNRKMKVIMKIPELHSGDAKFYKDNIITSVNSKLTMYDISGNLISSYDGINTNWIDSLPDENLIIYGNTNKQIGLVTLDENNKILSNEIIIEKENYQIDPTIIKVNDTYYITMTEIEGSVNNSDINAKNGTYTVHLYKSSDLKQWDFVTDIIKADNNIEDVDIFYKNKKFYVVFEKEEVDKGNSEIDVLVSDDENGTSFSKKHELLESTCDHEPEGIEISDNNYILYYSCDKNYVGQSYMGGQIFSAKYDDEWNPIYTDKQIYTENNSGILLYDIKTLKDRQVFLYAKNYLTSCDLVMEEQQ